MDTPSTEEVLTNMLAPLRESAINTMAEYVAQAAALAGRLAEQVAVEQGIEAALSTLQAAAQALTQELSLQWTREAFDRALENTTLFGFSPDQARILGLESE